MLQEILLNEPEEKKNNENLNEIINFFDKPFLNSQLNNRDFILPLNESISTEMGSNISLKEMENIMKDSPKNDFDDDIFLKKKKQNKKAQYPLKKTQN